MFDLALTESGDLVFSNVENRRKPFKINFNVTDGKALRLSFLVEGSPPIVPSENAIKLSFDIGQKLSNKKAVLLSEDDSKIQAIKIRIQTTLGDMAGRKSLGSRLETVRHKPLAEADTIRRTTALVKECISDIMPEAEILVKPEVVRTTKGYTQRMAIYIYNNNILIFKYA